MSALNLGKKSCKGDKYNLGPKGSESCSGESVSQANCFRVAKKFSRKTKC